MKRKIVDIEQSPFNKVYFLRLECGHKKTTKRRPDVYTDCKECLSGLKHMKKETDANAKSTR